MKIAVRGIEAASAFGAEPRGNGVTELGRYTNCVCDHCKKVLNDGDDVVICPVCGAPQHRACYNEHHACAHESEHASGYEWHFPTEGAGAKVACRHCGAYNNADAKSCRLCGAPLEEERHTFTGGSYERHSSARDWEDNARQYSGADTGSASQSFTVDEVSSEELQSYMGPSGRKLLPRFKSILEGSHAPSTWSIPGLVFGPFYLLYRKVKKPAYLLMLLLVAIHVPSFLYSIEAFKAYYAPQMFNITLTYSQTLLDLSAQLSNVMWFLRFVLHFYCGFCANGFILNAAIDDICDMHTRYNPDELHTVQYREALFFRGRPTVLRPVLWAMALFAVSYAVTYAIVIPLIP